MGRPLPVVDRRHPIRSGYHAEDHRPALNPTLDDQVEP
jgi:hypothetical protein